MWIESKIIVNYTHQKSGSDKFGTVLKPVLLSCCAVRRRRRGRESELTYFNFVYQVQKNQLGGVINGISIIAHEVTPLWSIPKTKQSEQFSLRRMAPPKCVLRGKII
jgi:hypothetical protein